MQRRLTAILSADVAGYSGLMEADEAGTLDRLKANRRRVFDPCLAAHGEAAVASVLEGRLSARQQLVVALARSILGGHAENSRHWISFDGY